MGPSSTERATVLSSATEVVKRARIGNGGAVFVTGPAGVGRSTALAAVVDALPADVEVRRGRADEMESALGLALIGQVLPGAVRAVGDAVADPTAPYLRALAELEGRDRPLVLAIDDLHRADGDSLAVLAFLARRIASLPVAIVATLRPWPEEARTVAAGLVDRGDAAVVELEPLTRAAAGVLLEERAGKALDDAEHERVWELCRGNPALTVIAGDGLVHERPATAGHEGTGTDATATDRTGTDRRPVDELRATRFAGLDGDALALARSIGVLGERAAPGVAVALSGLDSAQADRALRALHRSGLLTDDGALLRFAQPLLGRLLVDELSPAVLGRLHARAFAELERRGASQAAVEHALRADLVGDRSAADALERVGRASLRRGAVETAIRQLEAAIRFRGDQAGAAAWVLLAEACCAAGRADAGVRAARSALACEPLELGDRVAALTALGRSRYLAGTPDRGATALDQACALAADHDPAAAVVALLHHAPSAWAVGGPGSALPIAERARQLASVAGVDPLLREQAEATWGSTAAECGDLRGIEATLPVRGRVLGDPSAEGLTSAALVTPAASIYAFAHCSNYLERFGDASAAFELARRRIEHEGAAPALAMVTLFVGNIRVRRGRLVEALQDAERAARFSELTPLTLPVADALRAVATAWLGRDAESVAAGRAALAAGDFWLVRLWTSIASGLRLLWAADAAASDAFLDVERVLDAAGVREPNHTQWHGHAVAAHLLADRPADAERVLGALAPRAAAHPAAWPRFVLALGRARLAEHRGAVEPAIDGYRDALVLLDGVDLPLQRTEAQLALGRALRRIGRPVEARGLLVDALRTAEACGAVPLASAAASELRLAGGRRRRPGPDRDLLTAAELRVARAAAAGHSNAEIARALHVSVNTVSTHLRRTYAKLGVDGRGRLAALDLDAHEHAGDG